VAGSCSAATQSLLTSCKNKSVSEAAAEPAEAEVEAVAEVGAGVREAVVVEGAAAEEEEEEALSACFCLRRCAAKSESLKSGRNARSDHKTEQNNAYKMSKWRRGIGKW
jgi:hypothetical protein